MSDKTGKTYNPDDSRVNVVIRLLGLIFFVLGIALTAETYSQVGADVIQPPLVPVFYLCSLMLVIAGLLAVFAKYKPSGQVKQ